MDDLLLVGLINWWLLFSDPQGRGGANTGLLARQFMNLSCRDNSIVDGDF